MRSAVSGFAAVWWANGYRLDEITHLVREDDEGSGVGSDRPELALHERHSYQSLTH
jgi:hypothetical protein